ncbi:hypothetical protein TRAPUB_5246 [Trametes pubescens]|uniref:F-box domain-containing protein n=1 Tax=Trametes pubescens TaxID=154538 RepID=A0A1M2V916_TRAPU|nr:hypothetical protein TRAPUB_5246 [Trametes pubescens]
MASQSAEQVLAHVARESEWRLKALTSLSTELVALRQLHNTVALPNRLPEEIILEVLKNVVDRRHGDVGHIVRATHVCKRWRDIALNAPSLWTYFAIDRLDVTTTFLERSRSMPISVFLTNPRHPMHQISRLLAPHLPRMRGIRVRCPPDQNIERFFGRLSSPAPMLLELLVEKRSKPNVEGPDMSLVSAARLFGGTFPFPSLLKLCIRNVGIFPSTTIPCSLLTLDIVQTTSRGLPSLKHLVEFLGQCPLLERLRFAGGPRPQDTDLVDIGLSVSLPRLVHVYIQSSEVFMFSLLNRLSVPHATLMRLQTRYAGNGYDMIPPSSEGTLQCLAGLRRLEFAFDEGKFILRAFHTPDAAPEPALELGLAMLTRAQDDLTELMCPWPLDVSHVESVVVSGPPRRLNNVNIGHALSHFPNLTSLRVVSMYGHTLRDLLNYLCIRKTPVAGGPNDSEIEHAEPRDLDTPAAVLLCPKLETLQLCDIDRGMVIKEPLHKIVALRSPNRGGALKELSLCMVQGWNEVEAMELGVASEGAITLCVDMGEKWLSMEAGSETLRDFEVHSPDGNGQDAYVRVDLGPCVP